MNESAPYHDSRRLSPHEEVHLIKRPGNDKWMVASIDLTWVQGPYAWPEGAPLPVPEGFNWTKVYARQLGWDKHQFDACDQAYAYVDEQLQAGNVPWRVVATVQSVGGRFFL